MRFPVCLGTCVLLCSLPLAAQLANSSVTVTATPASNTPPDEVIFSVVVGSGLDQTVDSIVNAVSSLGLTAANLVNLSAVSLQFSQLNGTFVQPSSEPPEQWTFQLIAPFSKMKATTAALTSLENSIGHTTPGMSLTWSVNGTQLSSQSANCNFANLVAQARAQMQQIANAASVKPGAIVYLTNSNSACALTASFALGTPSSTTSLMITTTDALPTAPDQAIIDIYVTSNASASLADINAALSAAGVTGTSFTGVSPQAVLYDPGLGSAPAENTNVWTFTETIPLTKLKDTLAQLATAGQTIAAGNSGLTVSFGAAGLSFSQSPVCSQAELLSEARAQAENVASAAGVNAGPVLSLSAGGYDATAALVAVGGRLGAVFSGPAVYYAVPSVPLQTPTCSLTAQFQLF